MLVMLVALTVMSQAPETRSPIAVVISSKRPNAETFSPKLAAKVLEALRKEGIGPLLDDTAATRELKLAGFGDPKSCAGGTSCVAKLAVLLGAKAVVIGVDVGKVSKSLAIHLEAMAADVDDPLATVDFLAPADKWADKAGQPIAQFVSALKEKLAIKKHPSAFEPTPEVEPVVATGSDAPRNTTLTPAPSKVTEPPLVVGVKAKGKPVKVLPWVFAGGAVVTAGVSGIFAGMGFADKATFDSKRIALGNGEYGSQLTQQQATGLANSANTKLTIALTTGIVTAALAGVSVFFFSRD